MFNKYTVSEINLRNIGSSNLKELYIPLWNDCSNRAYSGNSSIGDNAYIKKGNANTYPSTNTSTESTLYTINSNWLPSQKFAFEASIYSSGNTIYTVYAGIYDMTSSIALTQTQISTTSTVAITIRSNQFTISTGHKIGVYLYTSNTASTANLTNVNLVVFL